MVHIVNILPAGGRDSWSKKACEALQDILDKCNRMVFVEMMGKKEREKELFQ